MSSAGSIITNRAQAKNALAQGRAAQSAYYQAAANLETEARGENAIAARNMMTMRRNQSGAMASARVARGASGLTDEGTGDSAERAVAEHLEEQISNAMISAAINDQNKRYGAAMQRWQGDATMTAAANQAAQYKAAANGAIVATAIEVAGAAIGGAAGVGAAGNGATAWEVAKSTGGGALQGMQIGGLAGSWLPGSAANPRNGLNALGDVLGGTGRKSDKLGKINRILNSI